jgi:hypothetical protein
MGQSQARPLSIRTNSSDVSTPCIVARRDLLGCLQNACVICSVCNVNPDSMHHAPVKPKQMQCTKHFRPAPIGVDRIQLAINYSKSTQFPLTYTEQKVSCQLPFWAMG